MIQDNSRIGLYSTKTIAGESISAYIPPKLPPFPPIQFDLQLLEKASAALGRLDGIRFILPDTTLFLYMYVTKEALLSSQIEGTQSSLSELLLFNADPTQKLPLDDIQEVSSYITAINYGINRLKTLPISLRMMREIHKKLMSNTRGSTKTPGEFRTSQNWIGGTRPGTAAFVPPPPGHLSKLLGDLEDFMHDAETHLPTLIKISLIHAQFETIHPFLDGNGRLGRLLITLLLCAQNLLAEPYLYLSLYLKTNRKQYYHHLQAIRETGDWESWISFFLTGIVETAEQALQTAQTIKALFEEHQKKIETSPAYTHAMSVVYDHIKQHPITTPKQMTLQCKLSLPTVIKIASKFEKLGILTETTGKKRHRVFAYTDYLNILSIGTEPLPR